MTNRFISKIKDVYSVSIRHTEIKKDIIALILIAVVITLSSISPLSSGNKVNFNDDFLYYAGMHESVRKSVVEYHTFPTRSFWIGGGIPTIGNPEDPTLNPMTLITTVFGSIIGLKIITFLSLLIGGLSTYLLARYILGYTRWGALFSGLIFGLCVYVPFRIYDGNVNDIYVTFLPLCLLLIGLACRGQKSALLILSFVFYIMISDGKLTAVMTFLYLGILCLLDVIPLFNIFGMKKLERVNIKPLKVLLLALAVTFFVGMLRILPSLELIATKGGLGGNFLWYQSNMYNPSGVVTFKQLWQYLICYGTRLHVLNIGLFPVLLALSVFFIFPRKAFPWGVTIFLFGWLTLAYNAPVDLFKLLWSLPIFKLITKPFKYFTCQIVFTFAIVAGQFFWVLAKIRPRWMEHVLAILLISISVLFLFPRSYAIQKNTYTYDIPAKYLVKETEFYNVMGKDISRFRIEPLNSIIYTNIVRNVGTIDTPINIGEKAVPKYFVNANGTYIPNYKYRGEAYFNDSMNSAEAAFRPNSIVVQVNLQKPDTLIINQNYHRDWHTDHGMVFEKNGLIALKLNEPGSYKVTMRYISRSFFAGLAVSFLSLIMLIAVCWSYRTGRLITWSQNTSGPLRHISRFILWLID